jgi:hypothetical protein
MSNMAVDLLCTTHNEHLASGGWVRLCPSIDPLMCEANVKIMGRQLGKGNITRVVALCT